MKPLAPNGVKIVRNLSCLDLFSFEVVDRRHRLNLEQVFGRYEEQVALRTQDILSKLRVGSNDIKTEILDVLALKVLSFFRNPHCVRKAMNTFGALASYAPTDPELRSVYEAVLKGSRPHTAAICKMFDLTPDLYKGWLRSLFLLLAPLGPIPFFDRVMKGVFEGCCIVMNVFEFTHSDESDVCLLSDRGFNVPEQTDGTCMFEFNMNSRAFAVFCMSDLAEYDVPANVKAKMMGRVDV